MLIGAGLNTLLDALFIYGFDWGIEGGCLGYGDRYGCVVQRL